MSKIRWAYGITTVPSRMKTYLPRTLQSLAASGFNLPRLFIDGDKDLDLWRTEFPTVLEFTLRYPAIRTVGNWLLAMWELYIRNPIADRYAIFQDDFVTCLNLREYLNRCPYPEKGYLNLYTFPSNQIVFKQDPITRQVELGWKEARELTDGGVYHGKKGQSGRSAIGLVFSREAASVLLSSEHMAMKPLSTDMGHVKLDGAVVAAMNKAGWREYVHNPSLTQHIGIESSMMSPRHKLSMSFQGENFDALSLLGGKVVGELIETPIGEGRDGYR